jgi:hypothetical protein
LHSRVVRQGRERSRLDRCANSPHERLIEKQIVQRGKARAENLIALM